MIEYFDAKFDPPARNDRNYFFSFQVTQDSIKNLTERIIKVNEEDDYYEKFFKLHNLSYERKPLKVYIDSLGGTIYFCFGLLSIMDKSKTPIHTIVTGSAMSCGFLILIHGHKRFGYELSTPLYHQVSSNISGKIADIEEEYFESKRLQNKIEELTIRKTKITKVKLKEIYEKKKDWFMTANEAKKLGVIDEIL